MALKHQNNIQASFSMASMTDVIFLLLVFFMVTSTFVFPTAMEINLPEGVEQTAIKPSTAVYIDADGNITVGYASGERQSADTSTLYDYISLAFAQDTTQTAVAIHADEAVAYGKIVEVLNVGASHGVKMVLATRPVSSRAQSESEPAGEGENTPGDTPETSSQI